MQKIIFIHRQNPSSTGNGAQHRNYQILQDLLQAASEANIDILKLTPDIRYNRSDLYKPTKAGAYLYEIKDRLNLSKKVFQFSANPHRTLGYLAEEAAKKASFGSVPVEEYEALLNQCHEAICVLDHPGQHQIVSLNRNRNIPTVYCPQNLETLDRNISFLDVPMEKQKIIGELFCELEVLSGCQERLPISKLETSLLDGLGLKSEYYPYRPVGELYNRLVEIRQQRSRITLTRGLFLMAGSAHHQSTGKSFKWFIDQANLNGLPDGIKVVIVGRDTDKLIQGIHVPGLEALGWVDQQEFDQLMLQVQAALIPQQTGFGAVTRLPEYSCAGIPTIVSEYPTNAIDIPPGIICVKDVWSEWIYGMKSVNKLDIRPDSLEEYLAWDGLQKKTLQQTIDKYL